MAQARDFPARGLLVHDAFLAGAHHLRLGGLQGGLGGLRSPLLIASSTLRTCRASRSATLVDLRAARDHARFLLGRFGIGHGALCAKGPSRNDQAGRCSLKEDGGGSPPPQWPAGYSGGNRVRQCRIENGPALGDLFRPHRVMAGDDGGRSAAPKAAIGGFTRARAGSPWIWASSALMPETSALPSNNLRIATACSWRGLVAMTPRARAEVGVAIRRCRDAAGETPGRAPRADAASVEGKTSKLAEIFAASRA